MKKVKAFWEKIFFGNGDLSTLCDKEMDEMLGNGVLSPICGEGIYFGLSQNVFGGGGRIGQIEKRNGMKVLWRKIQTRRLIRSQI